MSRPENFVLVKKRSQQPLITEAAASRNWELSKEEPDIQIACADNSTVRLHSEVFLCHSKNMMSDVEKRRREGTPKPRFDFPSVKYLDLIDVAHFLYSGYGSIPAGWSQNDALAKQKSWRSILKRLGVEAHIIKGREGNNLPVWQHFFQCSIRDRSEESICSELFYSLDNEETQASISLEGTEDNLTLSIRSINNNCKCEFCGMPFFLFDDLNSHMTSFHTSNVQ